MTKKITVLLVLLLILSMSACNKTKSICDCGQSTDLSMNFCPNCGISLNTVSDPQTDSEVDNTDIEQNTSSNNESQMIDISLSDAEAIVGKWRTDFDDGYTIYTITSDGYCQGEYYDNPDDRRVIVNVYPSFCSCCRSSSWGNKKYYGNANVSFIDNKLKVVYEQYDSPRKYYGYSFNDDYTQLTITDDENYSKTVWNKID